MRSFYLLVTVYLWALSTAFSPVLPLNVKHLAVHHENTSRLHAVVTAPLEPLSDELKLLLKKPSKTLAVLVGTRFDEEQVSQNDVDGRSMQIRQINAAAIVTDSVVDAQVFVNEQQAAMGSFPGPCPIIYTGGANDVPKGVTARVVDWNVPVNEDAPGTTSTLYRVSKATDVEALHMDSTACAGFWIDEKDPELVDELLRAIPNGSVAVVEVESMMDENEEITLSKRFKELGATAIVLKDAIVGDAEDIEYASFCIAGLTKKRSSTFNMTGLTGTTNGHFGGVASKVATTWLRTTRSE